MTDYGGGGPKLAVSITIVTDSILAFRRALTIARNGKHPQTGGVN
jgi:hypothetical protein